MPNSTAILGAGVKLGYADIGTSSSSSGPTYLAEVLDLTPGEESVGKIDISNHDSPNRKKEYIAGWIEVGDTTADLIYNKTDAATVRTILESRVTRTWTILFPDGSTLVFVGFLTQVGHAIPLEKEITTKVAICASESSVVFTPGS